LVGDSHQEIAAPGTWLGQTLTRNAQDRSPCDSRRDRDAQRGARRPGDHLRATLRSAPGIDAQVTPQIRAARLETKAGQYFQADLHETAGERLRPCQPEPSARGRIGRNVEPVGFRAIGIRRVIYPDVQGRPAEEVLDPKVRVVGDISLDLPSPYGRWCGGFPTREFAVIRAAAYRIGKGFMGGVQFLGAFGGFGGTAIDVGVMPLRQ